MKPYQLISRVLSGQATNSEIADLESLAKQDCDTREEFEDLKLLWFYQQFQSEADKDAARGAFKKLENLIRQRARQRNLAISWIIISLTIVIVGTILYTH